MPPTLAAQMTPAPARELRASHEKRAFSRLQQRLAPLYRRVFEDPQAPRTVVVVPSLSLEDEPLAQLDDPRHFEERLLPLLWLLRLPRTRLVYVTSQPVDEAVIEYHLRLLEAAPGGIPPREARRRLVLLALGDADEPLSLTRKILARPDFLERLRAAVLERRNAHLTCYNVTSLERRLALELGIPLYGCDPELADLGTKSASREIFAALGLATPPGHERLRDEHDVVEALAALKQRCPDLARAVIKVEHGSAGEGNAVFTYAGAPAGGALRPWIAARLPRHFESVLPGQSWESYAAAFRQTGGVVEAFIEGARSRSPSVQGRIDPLGKVELISTHDQLLGGGNSQAFEGCVFPAAVSYRQALHEAGLRVGGELSRRGVVGRFGIDFVTLCQREARGQCEPRGRRSFRHFALEINLRKGGTTHPLHVLQLLAGGRYDVQSGLYRTDRGASLAYLSIEDLHDPRFERVGLEALLARAAKRRLHFDQETLEGVVFEPLGSLYEHGHLGLIAIAGQTARARFLARRAVELVEAEAGQPDRPSR